MLFVDGAMTARTVGPARCARRSWFDWRAWNLLGTGCPIYALHDLVFNAGHWWLNSPELATAWRQIQSAEHRARRKRQIVEALMHYRAERDAWDSLF